jgi:hypothetical protein
LLKFLDTFLSKPAFLSFASPEARSPFPTPAEANGANRTKIYQ